MAIESARFTNIDGSYIDMNTADIQLPFFRMETEVEIRYTDKSKSQVHGNWPSASYLGRRIFHFEGDIVEDTAAEYWDRRRELLRAVMPRPHLGHKVIGTLQLQLTGINEMLSADCSLDGYPELPISVDHGSPSIGAFQLNFKAPDPKLYGPEQSATMTAPIISETNLGVAFNIAFNVTFPAGSNQPSNVIITNSGDIETYPRVRIAGYVESPRLSLTRHDGTYHQIALEGLTLNNTDYVDIDFKTRTAIMNGGINVYGYTTLSDWWALEPTNNDVDNVVQYSGSNIQSNSYAIMYWRNAYMI